jgi:CBS domain-containing protein
LENSRATSIVAAPERPAGNYAIRSVASPMPWHSSEREGAGEEVSTMTATQLVVADVMTRRFVVAASEDTLAETAEKMVADDLGSALVLEYGRLIGILTSRDVLRAIASRAHPSVARVRQWMSGDAATVTADATTDEAARTMIAGGFHHLPVVDAENRPLGVVGFRAVSGTLHWQQTPERRNAS